MTPYVRLAEAFARVVHRHHRENFTGDPYVLHLARVAALVEHDTAKVLAWLHDTIEDTETTAADLRAAGFPDDIVADVVALSHEDEPYPVYIDAIRARGSVHAIAVKAADLRDHLRPSPYLPERMRRKYERALARLLA
jgi:(p)ppGpp synthase/HD superfamily hydrolase